MPTIEIPIEWVKPLREMIEVAVEHIEEYNLFHFYNFDVIREIYVKLGGNLDDIF